MCILAAVPPVLAGALSTEAVSVALSVCILLILVACGVWLFVRCGIIQGSYQKLLQEGDYTPEKKKANRILGVFQGLTGVWLQPFISISVSHGITGKAPG